MPNLRIERHLVKGIRAVPSRACNLSDEATPGVTLDGIDLRSRCGSCHAYRISGEKRPEMRRPAISCCFRWHRGHGIGTEPAQRKCPVGRTCPLSRSQTSCACGRHRLYTRLAVREHRFLTALCRFVGVRFISSVKLRRAQRHARYTFATT
ncbi:hypothetical protein PYCCODRAFT_314066 [Trametes coccinea BRFM310]|uniref:Uncharacterized protein n=1 Tax=Trametes coccinea (strain BRFM310) TaxID=1353009 RepID=A0A1Y2ISE6_TRAC3|nr:hypothetical protein PYCCODRAFT_314066 [Trametes coccinea BRFM310]